jgi:hypothetical protein
MRRRVIFDTSVINRLADDVRFSDVLIAGLTSAYHVRLTATNVEEVIATEAPDRRKLLLDVCKGLLQGDESEVIQPFHWIIERLIAECEMLNLSAWDRISVRSREYEREVCLREVIDDEMSRQERAHAINAKLQFEKIFSEARPRFEELFASGKDTRPETLRELVTRLQSPNGAFWKFGADFYERAAKRTPEETRVRQFVAECVPFRALLFAICTAHYEFCIREVEDSDKSLAHRNDLLMAVYLPYCDLFVSDDRGQQRWLREIVTLTGLATQVRWYREFRDSLIGNAATSVHSRRK